MRQNLSIIKFYNVLQNRRPVEGAGFLDMGEMSFGRRCCLAEADTRIDILRRSPYDRV